MQRRRRLASRFARSNPPRDWKEVTLHWLEDHPYRHHSWMQRFVGRLEEATDDATIMKLKKQLQTWLEGIAADESAAAGDSPSAADINRALLMGTLGVGDSGLAIADVPGIISQPDRIGHGVRRRRAATPPVPAPRVEREEPLPGIAATHALFMLQIWGAVEDAVTAVRRHGLLVDTLEDPYESDNITRLYAWGEDENVVREWRDDGVERQGTGDLYYYRVLDDDTARIHGSRFEGPLAPGGQGREEPHRVGPRGTVISGTLRPQDLIPAFYAELDRVAPARRGRLENEMRMWRVELEEGETDPEEDKEFVYLLVERLNEVAPHGIYFGAHHDGGSDFGWWETREETEYPPRIRGLTTEQPTIDYGDYDEHSVGDEENTASWQIGWRPGYPQTYYVRVWYDTPHATDTIGEDGPYGTAEEAFRAGRDAAVGWCIDNDVPYEDEETESPRHELPTADANLERLERRMRPLGAFAYRLFIRGNRTQAVGAAIHRGFTVIESRTLPSDDRDRERTGVDAWTLDGDGADDWFEATRRSQDRPGALLYAEQLGDVHYNDLDTFTHAYIEAALWSTNDESTPAGGVPLDENYDPNDIAPDTLRQMLADCVRFRVENAADLRELDTDEQAGHDFWLTREGHGTGFWDRGNGALGDRLAEAARRFGEFGLIVGDDGMIHH